MEERYNSIDASTPPAEEAGTEFEPESVADRMSPTEAQSLGRLGIDGQLANDATDAKHESYRQTVRERLAARREEKRRAREQRPLSPAQIATRGVLAELGRDARKARRLAKGRSPRTA